MAKKANPRIVVEETWNGFWLVRIELAGTDWNGAGRGEELKTWSRKSLAMKAAKTLRERLAGHDWSKCPIEVEE